jgi:hypothetical protein
MEAIASFVAALVGAIPKIVSLVRSGKDIKEIKLGDVVSTDALESFRRAHDKAQDFINNG